MDVYFGDSSNPKLIEFKNFRGFNFTRNMNGGGMLNLNMDYSVTSKSIGVGYRVMVYENNKEVFYGTVFGRNVSDNMKNISITCKDLAGLVDRRKIYQLANFSDFGHTEIKEKLNGLELQKGFTISADDLVQNTGNEYAWHGENISLGRYCTDIAERSVGISGNNLPYAWWVTPKGETIFNQFGATAVHKDIPIKKIALSEDLDNTFNNIEVKGLPLYSLPYDKDYWTERDLGWSLGGGSGMLSNISDDFANVGVASIKESFYVDTSAPFPFGLERQHSIYDIDNLLNGENIQNITYSFYQTAIPDSYPLRIGINHSLGSDFVSIDMKDYSAGAWHTIEADFTGVTIGTVNYIYYTPFGGVSNSVAGDFYIDNLFVSFLPFSDSQNDQDSIDQYGQFDKTFIAKEFTTNAECEQLAIDMLAKYKDAKETYTIAIDGFYDIYPNSTFTFEYDGVTKNRVVKSVTYYDTVDGSIAMQVILADAMVLDIDEVLLKKFAEINTNTYLEAYPYRIG